MMLVSFMIAYHDAELIFNKQRKQLYICIYIKREREAYNTVVCYLYHYYVKYKDIMNAKVLDI